MFIIEKPKEIHLKSWKEIINESASSNSFQFTEVNFNLFWSNIFQEDYFAFAAKNVDKFMGIVVAKINETYFEKNILLDVLYVLPEFRKIGVARSLMNKLEEIANDQKLELVINGIEKSNLLAQKLFKNYTVVNRTRYSKKA